MLHLHFYRKSLYWLSGILMILLLLAGLRVTFAIEIPPDGSIAFIQTSGPNANLSNGDFYSSEDGGDEPHIIRFFIPCAWPATEPVTVALFDPESQTPDPTQPSAIDEVIGTPDDTVYTLTTPAGETVRDVTYTPDGGTNGLWNELVTFTTNTPEYGCGEYVLTVRTVDDDEQSWRLSVAHDPDCTVSTASAGSCSGIGSQQSLLNNGNERDDFDQEPGTGDAITVNVLQVAFQHAGSECQDFYFFVGADDTEVTLHNFDMDINAQDPTAEVNYYPPVPDGGTTRVIPGTVSNDNSWNGGQAAPPFPPERVGDTLIIDPAQDVGWWRAEVCAADKNQYVFESEAELYYEQPPAPLMTVTKDDGVIVTEPNAILTYDIVFNNISDTTSTPGAAANVVLTDLLPANTTFLDCAVNAPSTGTCSASGDVVTATIDGLIFAGTGGSIQIRVQVNPDATGNVVNEVTLDYQDVLGNQYMPVSDDDVDIIQSDLSLVATKQVTPVVTDAVAPCEVLSRETLTYTVVITNSGDLPATNVQFADTPDANTTLLAGSLTTSKGAITSGATPISVAIGALAPGEEVTISYQAMVKGELPVDGILVTNQGQVSADDFDSILTDNPATVVFGDATTILACPPPVSPGTPLLDATKLVQAVDTRADPTCGVLIDEVLDYTVTIINNGDEPAAQVTFEDTPDPNTQLLNGTVETTPGRVTSGNFPNETTIGAVIGTLDPGESATIRYQVRVRDELPAPRVMVQNQGIARASNVDDTLTDDPTTTIVGDPTTIEACQGEPTAVDLTRFTAQTQGDTVVVRWTTSAEIDTWGFYLFRSSDGRRASAERVTPELILAEGRGQGGASYTWTDTDVTGGETYTYWLQELEVEGGVNEYGPATTAAPSARQQVILPLLQQ